jgi:hypothetical protein
VIPFGGSPPHPGGHVPAGKEDQAVQEELKQIDTAPIDALLGIQAEQKQLEGLLAKAEGTKGKVSEAVYKRVKQDYGARLEALEARARPLRDQARQQQGRLRPLHERFRRALEDARLDVEELQFRREVGELAEGDFTTKKTGLDEALAQKDRDFQEADALSQRFVSVVGVAPEPAPAPAPPAPAAPPPPADIAEPPTSPRTKTPVLTPSAAAPKPPVRPPSPPAEAAQEETLYQDAPDEDQRTSPEIAVEGTIMMQFATLVAQEGKPAQEYRLGSRTSIGRVKDNEVSIPTPSISRKHAVIALTAEGYVITDLDSGNGTFVNEERVQMARLQDGDKIRLGDRSFVFRAPGR